MTAAAHETRNSPRSIWLLSLALLLTAAVFARSLSSGFVYDDHLTVQRNPAVGRPSELIASLAKPMWDFSTPQDQATVGFWRPLSNIALAIGRALDHGQPAGFHALCLVLHLLATWAAFRLARRLTQDAGIAFFAALLFGLHPVHVEAVSWISAINEPLSGSFVLLSLGAWVGWRERGSIGRPWFAGAWFFLGVLSQELAVATIPLALTIDVVRSRLGGEREWIPHALRAYAPFATALLVWFVARIFVFGGIGAGFDRTTTDFGVGFARLMLLRVEILGNGLKFLVWPAHLRTFHPFVPAASWSLIGPPALVCAAWAALVAVAWKRRALLATTAALFAPVALLPLVVRVQALGLFPIAERYLYVATFGVTLLVALQAWRFLPRALAIVILSLAAVVLGMRTFDRLAVWKTDDTLLHEAARESPRSPYVHRVLGRHLLDEYRRTHETKTLNAAHQEFQTTLDLGLDAQRGDDTIFAVSDDFLQANVGLAWSLIYAAEIDEQHDFGAPIQVLDGVVKRYPKSPEAWTALGIAHYGRGELDESHAALEKALAIDRNFMEAHTALGKVWMRRGDASKARGEFETALRLGPGDVGHYVNLVGAQERLGDDTAAMQTVLSGLQVAPDDERLLVMRGMLMAKHGNLDPALAEFDRVLLAHPSSSEAWLGKGKVLLLKHETTGALHAFQQAAEFDTTSFEAHYNAGTMMLSDPTQNRSAAIEFLVRAYENRGDSEAGKTLRESLLKLSIESADTNVELAAADADRKDYDGALVWIERALKLDPDNGKALYLKGGMLQAKGDPQGALTAWKRACEVLPDSVFAFISTGSLLAEMGNHAEARTYLEKGRDLARADPKAAEILPAIDHQIEELDRKK